LHEPGDFEEAIQLVAAGKPPLDASITQASPVEKTERVFETIDQNPEGAKYLIQCSE